MVMQCLSFYIYRNSGFVLGQRDFQVSNSNAYMYEVSRTNLKLWRRFIGRDKVTFYFWLKLWPWPSPRYLKVVHHIVWHFIFNSKLVLGPRDVKVAGDTPPNGKCIYRIYEVSWRYLKVLKKFRLGQSYNFTFEI